VINDVWGLQKGPDMAPVAAETEAALIIMHNREEEDEQVDILADIRRFFDRSLALAAKAGVSEEVIILDPGIGFGKTSRQNVEAVARIPDLKEYGLPPPPARRSSGCMTSPSTSRLSGSFTACAGMSPAEGSHHLLQSVSCFSSMVNTAAAFTSTSRTMQMRPILSASLTS
jgi:hypothetical protein